MPRSKCRPNVSTYHEAVNMILEGVDPDLQLPITKKGDKFTTKSLCYLAGMLGLKIDAKIQEIYATLQATYNVPQEFIAWIRVMQQYNLGVAVPASYGTFQENVQKVLTFHNTLRSAAVTDTDDETDRTKYRDGEEIADQVTPEELTLRDTIEEWVVGEEEEDGTVPVKPKKDWDTLAAENPLAAQFVKSLMSTPPDFEEEEEEEHIGEWEYEETWEDEEGEL